MKTNTQTTFYPVTIKEKGEETFSVEEQDLLSTRLWTLMQKQARKYCGVDSTSMTIERAQDLLESLLFTVWLALGHGVTKEEALTGDPGLLVEAGQTILKDKLISVKLDWKFLCQDLPKVRNVYYDDTVKNLGLFFQNYNLYYEAHQIPCSIDYWLLHSVPEETKGICFIEEYLSRLQLENDFVTAFDSALVERLYEAYIPDFKNTFFNLCEPVLTNALGRVLLGLDPMALQISALDRDLLLAKLNGLSEEEIRRLLEEAARQMCETAGITEPIEVDYYKKAARALTFRIRETVKAGDLRHIFLTFREDSILFSPAT